MNRLPNVTFKIRSQNEFETGEMCYLEGDKACLLYTSPSPRDVEESRMPSSA